MKEIEKYSELAKYYDKVYSFKDYEAESELLKSLINSRRLSKGNDLLDIACGTGSHLKFFTEYRRVGIDLNPQMLELAKEKIPDAEFHEMDMIKLSLGKKFDVVMCLFSSIGYILEKELLIQAIKKFSEHVKDGGIIIIQPWLRKEDYKAGSPHMTTYKDDDLKIARVNISELKGENSYFEMHYLIGEKDKKVQHFIEYHELAFFSSEYIISLLENNDIKAEYFTNEILDERGFIIGVK